MRAGVEETVRNEQPGVGQFQGVFDNSVAGAKPRERPRLSQPPQRGDCPDPGDCVVE